MHYRLWKHASFDPTVEGGATAIEELKHCINANQTLWLMKGNNLVRHGWFIFQSNNSWWGKLN